MIRIIFLLYLATATLACYPQYNINSRVLPVHAKKLVILRPNGQYIDSLPVMTVEPDTSSLYRYIANTIRNSIVNEVIDLYFISQVYLKNNNKISTIEPAYLAITNNTGGFAKTGFILKEAGKVTKKDKTPYIDILKKNATNDPASLMSFTQLYPHEMGHVLIDMLCASDKNSNNVRSVDMHYFSVITDYSTAFNEGFAEHLENVSRIFEKNSEIRAGIFADLDQVRLTSTSAARGFERDFIYPFRLGYYKATMLSWYQKFESLKRYDHAVSGDIKYKSVKLRKGSLADNITYRNTGIHLNKRERRNLVQMHSTEGAINAFFTSLINSNLKYKYLERSFYKQFVIDRNLVKNPVNLFTPIQNQFIKYFVVLNNYVVINNSSRSQLIDFIEGYIQTFPQEEAEIKSIYKKTFGIDYSNKIPPPLWLMVKNYNHRMLTIDPFGAVTVPIYTFDLNAAEVEDLQILPGVAEEDAELIINHRNVNGFYYSLEQLAFIDGLSHEVSEKIQSSLFDEKVCNAALSGVGLNFNLGTIAIATLTYIFTRAFWYFLVIFGAIYFIFVKETQPNASKLIVLSLKYLAMWIAFVLTGLAIVFIQDNKILYFTIFTLLVSALAIVFYWKNGMKLRRTLISVAIMGLLIFISII